MAVSYKRLFHILIDKNMTTSQLQRLAGYSANISTRLKNNNYVSLESIEKICTALDCSIGDVVEFIPEDKNERGWFKWLEFHIWFNIKEVKETLHLQLLNISQRI